MEGQEEVEDNARRPLFPQPSTSSSSVKPRTEDSFFLEGDGGLRWVSNGIADERGVRSAECRDVVKAASGWKIGRETPSKRVIYLTDRARTGTTREVQLFLASGRLAA